MEDRAAVGKGAWIPICNLVRYHKMQGQYFWELGTDHALEWDADSSAEMERSIHW